MALKDWPVRVRADFNDLELCGTIDVLHDHAERRLAAEDPVILLDGEGNSMYGHVLELEGEIAVITVAAGTWHALDQPVFKCCGSDMAWTDFAHIRRYYCIHRAHHNVIYVDQRDGKWERKQQ